MVKVNTCVFISGKGSNLEKLILNSNYYNFPIKIKLVVSNNKKAEGLKFARKWSIPYLIIDNKQSISDYKILIKIKHYKVNLILLAGYMRILSKNFIRSFGKSIINIHPSLLPKFKGLNTYSRILKSKEVKAGCTVHYVDKKLDNGNSIIKKMFFIKEKDNEKTLKQRTQKLEYQAYPEAIIKIFKNN